MSRITVSPEAEEVYRMIQECLDAGGKVEFANWDGQQTVIFLWPMPSCRIKINVEIAV